MMFLVEAWLSRWRHLARRTADTDARTPMAVVTGGSDGIGLAIAREFGRAGYRLLLVARNQAKLDAAAASLGSELGTPVATAAIDVRAPYAISLIDQALDRLGGYCDVLVNCAGVGHAGPFETAPPDEIAALIDVNVQALAKFSRHYLPAMRSRARGGIMNVASTGGLTPGPWQAAYYASKAFVISLTEAVAYEARGQGVRIAVLVPGPVETAFHERMRGETGLYLKLMMPLSPERVARVAVRDFRWGRRVIAPGLLNMASGIALRLVPHFILIPIIGFLLKPRGRGREATVQKPGERKDARGESR